MNYVFFEANEEYDKKQHVRDKHREITASVSPPSKKRMDPEPVNEPEIERVMKEMEHLNVKERIVEDNVALEEVGLENQIPDRLDQMFKMKGIDIQTHKIIRVNGGGKCGVNCISIHTTGSEENATEIRKNTNEHIVENWDKVFKDSYEFPYTEHIGSTNKTFNDEDEFIDFLLHHPDQAALLWMTHVDMQAVSTMLNMKISILTTGVTTPNTNRCGRCKPGSMFSSNEELRLHMEKIHKKVETNDEKESCIQKARICPQNRLDLSQTCLHLFLKSLAFS